MRVGWFIVSLLLAVAGYGWWLGSAYASWAVGLGLLGALTLLVASYLWLGWRRSRLLGGSPATWRQDGEKVALVGILRWDTALLPVWSDRQAVAWEASIERRIPRRPGFLTSTDGDDFKTARARSQTPPSRIVQARGSSPLVVQVEGHGEVRLEGIPDFGLAGRRRLQPDAATWARCARWLLQYGPGAAAPTRPGPGPAYVCTTPRADARLQEVLSQARTLWTREGEDAAVAHLCDWLQGRQCELSEHVLTPGQRVGVFGYFRAARGVVDVAAGSDPWPELMVGEVRADLAQTRRRHLGLLGVLVLGNAIAHAILLSTR